MISGRARRVALEVIIAARENAAELRIHREVTVRARLIRAHTAVITGAVLPEVVANQGGRAPRRAKEPARVLFLRDYVVLNRGRTAFAETDLPVLVGVILHNRV